MCSNFACLLVIAYAGAVEDTIISSSGLESCNLEWEEYDDKFEYWWNYLITPLELKSASLFSISEITGLTIKDALSLRKSSRGSQYSSPRFRAHNLMTRRIGDKNTLNESRYDGSPIGLTQRYWLEFDKFKTGLIIDKDAYEPSFSDLVRFWLERKADNSRIIIGDFHVASGQGLGIWTTSSYFNTYDRPAQFRRNGRGISVSNDTAVNSALRGIAVEYNFTNISFSMFGSRRKMDAVVDNNSSTIFRLSDGGNHRSIGEREKYNSINERLIGSTVNYRFDNQQFHEVNFYAGSYLVNYDPLFRPDYSERTRFPFAGKRFGATFTGAAIAVDRMVIRGSTSADLSRNITWKAGIEYLPAMKSFPRIFLNFYNFPVKYQSPRAIVPLNRPNTTGKYGGALLVAGKLKNQMIREWTTHIEFSRKPWRGYLIPLPTTESRASVTVSLNLSPDTEQVIRYRRKSSQEGIIGGGLQRFTENRIRFTERFLFSSINRYNLKVWQEIARRDHLDGNIFIGGMVGFKANQQLQSTANVLDNIKLSLQVVAFSSEDRLSLYLGEYDIPYRLSSVKLSDKGFRYSGSLNIVFSKSRWIAVKIAQIRRLNSPTNSADLEFILSAAYIL